MKCGACGQEVALAKVCPYCGSKVEQTQEEAAGESSSSPKGTFRGRVEEPPAKSTTRGTFAGIGQILRFLLEPRIEPFKKALFLMALFYLLSPLDLLPGFILPVAGWLDDVAVVALALRYVASQLDKLDRR